MFHEGQQFGEYTLIEKIGRGGFGEVWLAETEEDFFAVKLPHKDQVDWKAITQEIGLWTLCGKHPNVMPLVGARNFNGQIAIISEYAPDGSLEDLLRTKGKLSVEEAVEMTIKILEGLAHLHESGIILLFDEDTDISEKEWLKAASKNDAVEFLNDEAEDIYTLKDGKLF